MLKTFAQLIRYGFIGVARNLAGYVVYLGITHVGMEPKRAMSLLYSIGVTIAFLAHRNWTFAHEGNSVASAHRFLWAYLVGYLVNLVVLYVFVDRLGYAHQWVQAGAIALVATILFAAMKLWVFPVARERG
jgi:putative flippase GtrA